MMRWILPLMWAAGVYGEGAHYVGSMTCGGCHAEQFNKQRMSEHSTALSRMETHRLKESFPRGVKFRRGRDYLFETAGGDGQLAMRLTDGKDAMELPVEWAFGSGRQAVTFVSKVSRDWYVEHFASYYPALKSYGTTPGQAAVTPKTIAEAAGLLYRTEDPGSGIKGCFECHSTGPVTFKADGAAEIFETGVGCEGCHGPGSEHAQKPSKKTIAVPRRLNEECGRCHRPPASGGAKTDWSYAWNVRHQPVYLAESACFRKSKGKLTCLTCHNPHEAGAGKLASSYNSVCARCHEKHNPGNCVDCHMPRVTPQDPLRFTNHWIGVYASGSKLKPVR